MGNVEIGAWEIAKALPKLRCISFRSSAMMAGDHLPSNLVECATWMSEIGPDAVKRDVIDATPEAASILSAMNLPRPSCRGPCGDRHALETMYKLSNCKNAILTLGSSFGSCISSLAEANRQFRVSEYGECLVSPPTDGPIDANTYSRKGNIKTYLAQRTD